jgi:osmoprotectant transport system permease protein
MLTAAIFTDLAHAWERNQETFWPQTWLFLSLTMRGLGLGLLLGIPAGLALTRLPRLAAPVIAALGVVQTVPSLVLLGLSIPLLGIGQPPALFAAVLYSLFPVVQNTYVGVTQVSPAVRDAARGMGMTRLQSLWNVELPLAFPVILAGVRTAAIYASAMIVIGAYIGAGGLGDYVYNGISRDDYGLILLGAIPILLLTLVLFLGLGGVERLARKSAAAGMAIGGGLIVFLSAYGLYEFGRQALQPPRTHFIVGAKDFTEGQILAEILKQMIEDRTGMRAEIRSNMGTSVIFTAIQHGKIDLYAEYTGVLLTSKEALDLPIPEDRSTITPLVRREMERRHGLVLLETFGLNNTYAPSVTKETAQRYRLAKISDLRRVPHVRVVIDLSFLTRPDGWAGLVEKYELAFDRPPTQVSPNLLYKALEQQEADVVIGFATDWQIQALNLVVLDDDRGYFPSYHGAPLVRASVLKRHPEIREALDALGGKIDDAAMRQLNYRVAVEKSSEADVAGEFLRRQGLLTGAKTR